MRKYAIIYNWVLACRYDIKIKGVELLDGGQPRLYLPNHQAEVDPQLLVSEIMKIHNVSAMISAKFYNLPIVNSLLKKLEAVPISDLDEGVRDVSVMDNIRNSASIAFAKGHSLVLYPSGQLSTQGYEKLFNKQSAYALTNEAADNVKIIGVRMHGLWGSMWSRAWIGVSPPFFKTYLLAVWFFLSNFIFFIPKRSIEIEFTDLTKEAKEKAKSLTRREFNAYLESFYNEKGEEQIRFIKHHFLSPNLNRKLPKNISGVINKEVKSIKFTKI